VAGADPTGGWVFSMPPVSDAMTSPAATTTLRLGSPAEHVFPRLTPAQMDRVAVHGQRRRVRSGEVLLEIGESGRIFVVTAGSVETMRVVADVEEIIVTHGVGSFTGEVAVLSGRRGLARNRAREAGEVIDSVGRVTSV